MFFEGYERLLYCGEAVVRKLLTKYPDAAVVFIEFRSAIMNRKTAQLLHTGIAQHYQIPIISYDDVIFPHLRNLLRQLNHSDSYSIPIGANTTIQPYPFGCHECRLDQVDEFYREDACYSACQFWGYTFDPYGNPNCDPTDIPEGRAPCNSPFFAHDEVHPSWYGHQVARDLIIELLAVTSREICMEKSQLTLTHDMIPNYRKQYYVLEKFGVYASKDLLAKQTDFVFVQSTSDERQMDELLASQSSDGFSLSTGGYGAIAWYCNSTAGGEYVEFKVRLPVNKCYVVYLASIKSYQSMGDYTIKMKDLTTQKVTRVDVVGIWKSPISISVDTQINTDDNDGSCTGKCQVRVTSHREKPDRGGNIVKITDLSVRPCYDRDSQDDLSNPADAGPWIAL
jgi:hypothetical protein